MDFELHWGVRDHLPPQGPYRDDLLGARVAIPRILQLFEEFEVAATWATVGLLFAATREDVRTFTPALRPHYRNTRLSPYEEPIGEEEGDDPIHLARSLVELIKNSPRQEIGSHTFSHYYCLEDGQTEQTFRADLESAQSIARSCGLELTSLVFPRNQVNPSYLVALKDHGFTAYRGCQSGIAYGVGQSRGSAIANKGRRLFDTYSNRNIVSTLTAWDQIVQPDDLCNVPATCFLRPYSSNLRFLEPLRLRRIRRSMQLAAQSHKIFHLWWHPHNFGRNLDENLAVLRNVLVEFRALRAREGMSSLTMGAVAERALSLSQE